jgi:hypothetical protein
MDYGGLWIKLYKYVLGNSGKPVTPRNVEVNEICDGSFQGQVTHEDLGLDSRTLEVLESRTRDNSES